MAHAPFPPSAAHRWLECAGSYQATLGLSSPDSVYSRLGTFAHDVAARCLSGGHDPAEFLLHESEGAEFLCDAEMVAHLRTYVQLVREEALRAGASMEVESAVVAIPDLVWGTSDCWFFDKARRTVHVWDLKYGSGEVVQATDNPQLMIYAIGVLKALGPALARTVERVVLHIVQPRDGSGEPHRTQELTPADLRQFYERLQAAVTLAQQPNAPLVPGAHCRWCPAAGTCPALTQHALDVATVAFDTPAPASPPDPRTLAPEQLDRILRAADVIETWLRAVRAHALDAAKAGTVIPNWKLVDRVGHRKWLSEELAAEVLAHAGIDPYDHRVISPAEAERRLGAAASALVSKLVEKPITGQLLVPVEDDRPPSQLTITNVFMP